MADNVAITAGTGTSVATDQVGSDHYQRIKLSDGTADSATVIAADEGTVANALRVVPANDITDATYIGDIKFGEALPAGTNAIGKLSANSGVDIGDVDVTSSALPTGAATAAKQPALGTAGTASADVITVQGIASMTPLTVDLGANNDVTLAELPDTGAGDLAAINAAVSGSLDVSGATVTVDLGANNDVTLATLPDTAGGDLAAINASTDGIEALLGTIDADTSALAGTVGGSELQVDIVGSLPAGTNGIGKLTANSGVDIGDVDVTSIANGSLNGPGSPTIDSYGDADVNLAANTANQSVVAAPGASKQIWVYGLIGTVDVAGSISIQDEDDTALSGVMPVGITGGFVMPNSGNFAMPWIKVPTNKALEIDTVTCTFDGIITYAIVSV